MADIDRRSGPAAPRKRADARRNEQTLLDAAAAVFVTSGVDAPVRDIAAKAGVGMGTIYRHFPTRADLIVAVYRHQVEACAEAGPALLANSGTPHAALTVNGSTSSLTSWSPSTDSPRRCSPTTPASRRCTPTSSTASCPCALSCSTPPPRPARSAPTWMPTNCCAASATSASAPTTTPATTHVAWSGCSSPGYVNRARHHRIGETYAIHRSRSPRAVSVDHLRPS